MISGDQREGFTRAECLGLCVAGGYFKSNRLLHRITYIFLIQSWSDVLVDLVQYLFTVPGVKSFLSRQICQDPIEKFFDCQRQKKSVELLPQALANFEPESRADSDVQSEFDASSKD